LRQIVTAGQSPSEIRGHYEKQTEYKSESIQIGNRRIPLTPQRDSGHGFIEHVLLALSYAAQAERQYRGRGEKIMGELARDPALPA
jgi:hypothetical protein